MLRKACAVLTAVLVVLTTAAGAASAWTPEPGAIFINPRGNTEAKDRIIDHIVGETENLNNCCTRNDIFLLKISAAGAVQWTRTYGGLDIDEGRDVQVSSTGYVVAGITASFGQGDVMAI